MSAAAGNDEGMSLSERLRSVRDKIAAAAGASERDPDRVTLVAVAKTHGEDKIREALLAGQRVFGENRVQEAQAKFPALKSEHPDLVLHLIGPLQTNKSKLAVELFDVIETVDRPKLARTLADAMEKTGRRPELFIQVNTGEEPQKAGVLPSETAELVALVRDELSLPLTGLMCIPPANEPPAPHFAFLSELAKRHGLSNLSMGMSGDFETAIKFGATHVRVGTAIFGERLPPGTA